MHEIAEFSKQNGETKLYGRANQKLSRVFKVTALSSVPDAYVRSVYNGFQERCDNLASTIEVIIRFWREIQLSIWINRVLAL